MQTPVNLTERQKELLREFETVSTGVVRSEPKEKGLWDKVKEEWNEVKDDIREWKNGMKG